VCFVEVKQDKENKKGEKTWDENPRKTVPFILVSYSSLLSSSSSPLFTDTHLLSFDLVNSLNQHNAFLNPVSKKRRVKKIF
jgi:hypothetical protein